LGDQSTARSADDLEVVRVVGLAAVFERDAVMHVQRLRLAPTAFA